MIHFGKWTYEPKTKTLSHSESEWAKSLRNITHNSDVDGFIDRVAENHKAIFDRDLARLMNRLFRCNGCDPDHPLEMQAMLKRNSARLEAMRNLASAKPIPKKKHGQ